MYFGSGWNDFAVPYKWPLEMDGQGWNNAEYEVAKAQVDCLGSPTSLIFRVLHS